jgi:hypothetical protein
MAFNHSSIATSFAVSDQTMARVSLLNPFNSTLGKSDSYVKDFVSSEYDKRMIQF